MKKTHIAALILIVVSIGVIIAMIGDYSHYETFATARSAEGKEFHIVGTLARQEDMEYNPERDPNYFSFYMKDTEGNVIYDVPHPMQTVFIKCPLKLHEGDIIRKRVKTTETVQPSEAL